MFTWRLKLREAREALNAGRLEDARRLVNDEQLREFLPAKQLAAQVAAKYADRARTRIARGESSPGLADLQAADDLAGPGSDADNVRAEYAEGVLRQAAGKLAAGEPRLALDRILRARQRGVSNAAMDDAEAIADAWLAARKSADAGDMADAADRLDRLGSLGATLDQTLGLTPGGGAPGFLGLGQRSEDKGRESRMSVAAAVDREARRLVTRARDHQAARERLHAAAATKCWDDALSAVEATLRLAPADTVALPLRRRLWKQLGMGLTASHRGRRGHTPLVYGNQSPAKPPLADRSDRAMRDRPADDRPRKLAQGLRDAAAGPGKSTTASGATGPDDTSAGANPADRRMLWVDAVGGFLVCLDDRVVIGQPSAGGAGPAIPILADLSRHHAVLRREGGHYVLEPSGPVAVDGQPVEAPMVLGAAHEITLGGSVRLRFSQPHALSATACLEIVSGHRTAPSADAVLLMAESCVLGPGAPSHIRSRAWKDDVIVFRRGKELLCRSTGELTVDGEPAAGPSVISPGSRVEGEDFSLAVEQA